MCSGNSSLSSTQIFFKGDSWLFYYSDTLIRLFPIRFWQDAFLWAAILALGGGVGLAFGLPPQVVSKQGIVGYST